MSKLGLKHPIISIPLILVLILGFVLLLPLEPGIESTEINGVSFEFVDSSELPESDGFKSVYRSNAMGVAEIGGDSVEISDDLLLIEYFTVCNHEMMHIDGRTHEGMGFWEYQGFSVHSECVELMNRVSA